MATIEEDIITIQEKLEKIPCLNGEGCNFQKETLEKMRDLSFKLDEMWNKYEPLLKAVLVEFDNHRKGISLILKGLGYPVDEIKGWDINDWEEEDANSEKSKGILRRFFKKIRRGKKNVRPRRN